MNKDSSVSVAGGSVFPSLLAVLFIGLKLLKVIDWSWWWVLSPIWIPLILTVLIVLIAIIIAAIKG